LAQTVEKTEYCNVCTVVELQHVFTRDPTSLLNTECFLDERSHTACVDTGATRSIIPKEVALKNQIVIQPSNVQIRVADGTVVTVAGESRNSVDVTVGEKTVQLKFLVLENVNCVLLGQDWMSKTNAILWPNK
jgi:hypothetical protein